MKRLLLILLAHFVSFAAIGQVSGNSSTDLIVPGNEVARAAATDKITYYYPPGYFGLLNNQLTSSRAQGMGFTTMNKSGIEHSFYNPASIAATEEPFQVYFNYANGHSYRPKSRYYYLGTAYRINEKIAIGASYFTYQDNNPLWTTIIGGADFDTDKFTQTGISLVASYRLMQGLDLGLAAHFLRENAVNGNKTNSDFIPAVGVNYAKDLAIFSSEKIQNQEIKVSGSLFNFILDNTTEQEYEGKISYNYLPIILRFGAAYGISIPLESGLAEGKKFFEGTTKALDLSLEIQYQDYLPGKNPVNTDHLYNGSFGVGSEAWFWDRLSLRLGYYTQKGPTGTEDNGDVWVTGNRSGFTWGYGAKIPTHQLTNKKLPFDVEVEFVTSSFMSTINEKIYTSPAVFTENNFQFCFGLNLLWKNNFSSP